MPPRCSPLVERREGAQAAVDDVRLYPARPHQPRGELFHVPVLGGLPVLAGLAQPVAPDAQVRVVDVAGRLAVALGVQQVRKELFAGVVE